MPATQEHGRRVHNMRATRDEVLAMATAEIKVETKAETQAETNAADGRRHR